MRKINVGIIGFGYMGKMHAMCYENLKYYYRMDVEICLYAVVTGKSPEELPVKFEKVYKSTEELFNDEKVDIVDICSSNHMHRDILIEAIRHGKPIYCEKPLARNLQEAQEIMEACRKYKYDKVSRINFEYRFVPAVIRAKQLLEQGRIGKIIQFNFRYYGSEFLDPERPISWQSAKEMSGGGVLFALGTHSLDLIRYLIGDVDEVSAQKKTCFKTRPVKDRPDERKEVDIEDILNIWLSCGDICGTLLLSQVAGGSGIDFSFEIYGEKGALRFNQENPNVLYFYDNTDPKEPVGGFGGFKAIETTQKYGGEAVFPPPRVNISWSRYHIAGIYDFIHAVVNNTEVHPNLEDGYRIQELTDAIYKSAENRRIEKIIRKDY